jgi:hypothetical protein
MRPKAGGIFHVGRGAHPLRLGTEAPSGTTLLQLATSVTQVQKQSAFGMEPQKEITTSASETCRTQGWMLAFQERGIA